MGDIEPGGGYPSTAILAKQGIAAVAYTAGGVLLYALQTVSRFRVLGLIAGAIICVAGIAALLSRDPADRKPGAVITAAGVLTVLSKTGIPLIKAAAGSLLSIGAFGLLALGIWNGIKFFIGLKKRS